MRTFAVIALLAVAAFANIDDGRQIDPQPGTIDDGRQIDPQPHTVIIEEHVNVKRQVETDPKAEIKPVDEPEHEVVKRENDPPVVLPTIPEAAEPAMPEEDIEKREKRQYESETETEAETPNETMPETETESEAPAAEESSYPEPENTGVQADEGSEYQKPEYGTDSETAQPKADVEIEFLGRQKRQVEGEVAVTRNKRYIDDGHEHGIPDCSCNHKYPHLPLYTALHKHCSYPGKPHPPCGTCGHNHGPKEPCHHHPHPPCSSCGHNHGPKAPCHGHGHGHVVHHHHVVPHAPVHRIHHDVHHHFVPRRPHYRAPCDRHEHFDHDNYDKK